MKRLTCEMCGSIELIKEDGVFVCQSCGCKYSVEDAKKLMVEGIVEVQGTVKVDGNVQVEGVASYDKLMKNGETYLRLEDYESAAKTFQIVVNGYPEKYDGYEKLIISISRRFKADATDDRKRIMELNEKMNKMAAENEKERCLDMYQKVQMYIKRLELLEKLNGYKKESDSLSRQKNSYSKRANTDKGNATLMGGAAAVAVVIGFISHNGIIMFLCFGFALIELAGTLSSFSMKKKEDTSLRQIQGKYIEVNNKICELEKELNMYIF